MTPDEIAALLSYLGSLSVGAVIGGGAIFLLVKSFIPTYLAEKGKNLATKEDIAAVTHEVEKVRAEYAKTLQEFAHQNALLLEQAREQSRLRVAAIDHRLAAHQEAFAMWRKLISHVHDEECRAVVIDCNKWWDTHCLYLSAEAREAFSDAYWAASIHSDLLQERGNHQPVYDNWAKLMRAGEVILKAVELPSLGEKESTSPDRPGPSALPRD